MKWGNAEATELAKKIKMILADWNSGVLNPSEFLENLHTKVREAYVSELNARLSEIKKTCCGDNEMCPGCE